jgi:uncharacterized protein (TIGR03067 family)
MVHFQFANLSDTLNLCAADFLNSEQTMNAINAAGIVTTALLTLTMGCSSTGSHNKTAMDKLEGNWICISAVVNGKPLVESTVQLLRLTLTPERYTTRRGSEVLFDSTYMTEPAGNPKQIDMVGTEGELTGKKAQGIYSLTGDTLTICYTMPGKPRPAAFESAPSSEAYLVSWKRERHQGAQ